VHLGLWSLVLGVLNIGLSVGVVIAVGMLLFFQVSVVELLQTVLFPDSTEKSSNSTYIWKFGLFHKIAKPRRERNLN
jgi:hypothetical protein